ncbi:bifunctional UDP-sugar hydrolase/5'-nucleotidase [Kineosporia sp. A_224]|uniref:bifunctional metallophosphatase/5'-nucleotidase n=1 Tax=Kineosporia sp. A_224 TaxID=1962180 RepID=UPI000B4AB779|nr:5'-nucleotidase C-terminal domain-containing protein [Kineosporia sp. A_224]
MRRTRPRHARLIAFGLASAAALLGTVGIPAATAADAPVTIQVLNVSDWHGQIVPLTVGTAQVGGAATLAGYFNAHRAENRNTLTLTSGDAVGATPPISSFFADEPTIRAMRLMGFDADTLGNHNFDAGLGRLQSQIDLARTDAPTVPGKRVRYLSANLKNLDANLDEVEKFRIFKVGGVKVAVIGLTNPEAPTLVFPGNFGTIEITDPVAAANRQRAIARKAGAQVVIGLIHAGVTGQDATGQAFGPLVEFARGVTGFDLILGDHTDIQYSGTVNGALVTENRSKGLTYSRVNLTVDKRRGVTAKAVDFFTPVSTGTTPDPAVAALVDSYSAQVTPILGTVIGSANREILRTDSCGTGNGRTCESLVGNVTTDAMRARYGTDFAITNSGGLRDRLTCPATGGGSGLCPVAGPVLNQITRGQVLAVLPFGNVATTTSIDGAELKTFLENGVSRMPAIDGRFPQVSGLCFTYDIQAAAGSRVTSAVRQAADGACTGAAVDLTAATSYTLAENDFMASGGDGYPVVTSRSVSREILDQVLADAVTATSPLTPSIQGRIVCTDSDPATGSACPVQTQTS